MNNAFKSTSRPIPEEVVAIRKPKFVLVPFAQIQVDTDPECLIDGLIPRGGLTLIWGKPKSFKSFLAYDMTMHIALGWDYRGRAVESGPVVYCSFEGGQAFAKRVAAFRQAKMQDHAGEGEVPFYHVSAPPINLADEHGELTNAIRANLNQVKPVVVVLDTLNRSLVGSENADVDMAGYVKAADAIRSAFDCAVIVVHHSGHDGARPRGHSALPAAVDAQLQVKREGEYRAVFRVEMMRDGEQGDSLVSKLEKVEVGRDSKGNPVTSLVVAPADGPPAQAGETEKAAKKEKLPARAVVAFRALREAINAGGKEAPASNHVPAGVRGCEIGLWRITAYALGISDGGDRAKQKAFKAGYERLLKDRYVAAWNDFCWIVRDIE